MSHAPKAGDLWLDLLDSELVLVIDCLVDAGAVFRCIVVQPSLKFPVVSSKRLLSCTRAIKNSSWSLFSRPD